MTWPAVRRTRRLGRCPRRLLGVAALALVWLAVNACTTTVVGNTGPQKGTRAQRVEAHLALARGYLENGDLERARGPLESALKIDPESSEVHVLLAVLYQAQGEKKDLVEREYRLALQYAPDNAQALNNYGIFLYEGGRYEEARKQFQRAVGNVDYPARAQAYENLGLCLLRLGDVEGAEQAFQRSLRLNATGARANLELSDIYFQAGDYPTAARYYSAFARAAPQGPRSLWLGIQLARALDNQDMAASYALALRNLYPGSDEYKFYQDSLK